MAGKLDAQNPAPRAYLNYLFFDKAMNYVTAGFKQISTAAKGVGVHEQVSLDEPFIADRQGYLLAYLSNENQEAVNIHFDDFTVYHGKTNIVQSQDYYPFGGSFNVFHRTASKPNSYLYNGGVELNEKTNYYETAFRHYDPQIGRFTAIDPLADQFGSWTPYQYAFNDPIYYNDPLGLAPNGALARDNTGGRGGAPGRSGIGSWVGLSSVSAFGNNHWTAGVHGGSFSDRVGAARDAGFVRKALNIFDDGGYICQKKVGVWDNGQSIIETVYGRIDINAMLSSSNPLNRVKAGAFLDGDVGLLGNFQDKSIHYSYGDYLTEISRTDNAGRIWQGIAAAGIGGALAGTVAAPIAVANITPSLSGVGTGTVLQRVTSVAIDGVSQVGINYAANGGDFGQALQDVNLTSLGLSALNPVASLKNVGLNVGLSSAFELTVDLKRSQNVFTGKSFGDVALSVGLSGGLYRVGSFGLQNTISRTSSHWNGGFQAGSKAMNREARIAIGSYLLGLSGTYNFFGN